MKVQVQAGDRIRYRSSLGLVDTLRVDKVEGGWIKGQGLAIRSWQVLEVVERPESGDGD